MGIKDYAFEETHCNICGCLNPNQENYTCDDCVKEEEKRHNRIKMLEELED